MLQERWSNQRLVAEIARRQELEEELVWLADHDTLTDVWNRRAFYDRADRAMEFVRRHGKAMSVLIIDADHFKSINDDHGHHVGDEAIRTLARLCKSNLRATGPVGSGRRRGVRGAHARHDAADRGGGRVAAPRTGGSGDDRAP